MSKQNVVQEVVIPCMMAEDSHMITGKIAYKAPGWSEENPTANLLCLPCSEVVLDDRTRRQVKLDDIRAMVVALAADEVHLETGTVVAETSVEVDLPAPDEVEANVVVEPKAPAEPRFCTICDELVPPEHPYPKHERCYVASALVVRSVSGLKEAKHRLSQAQHCIEEEAPQILTKLVEKKIVGEDEGLALDSAKVFFAKARAALENMNYLLAAQLAWLARDAVAERYASIMQLWLAGHVDKLRNKGFLSDDDKGKLPENLESYLINIETLIGEGKYLSAFYMLLNHDEGLPGAFYRVGYAYQRPQAKKVVEAMQEKLAALRMVDAEYEYKVPDEIRKAYFEAQKLLDQNPWKAWDVAMDVKNALHEHLQLAIKAAEQARIEAEKVEIAKFLEGMTLGARVLANAVPEDVDELEELLGGDGGGGWRNHKTKVQSDRGDGDETRPRKGKKQGTKVRGNRRAQEQVAIRDSLAQGALTVVEPVPA